MNTSTKYGYELYCALVKARGKLTQKDLAKLLNEVTRQNYHLNFYKGE